MFGRNASKSQTESFSKRSRSTKSKSGSFREHAVSKSRHDRPRKPPTEEGPPIGRYVVLHPPDKVSRSLTTIPSTLTSSIITLVVGREQRLFAAHEDVLCLSPFFQSACRGQFNQAQSKKIYLPDEEPEIFSSVLEYLYKGDYYPRLVHNKRRNAWELETGEGGTGSVESTVYHHGVDGELLKDTVIYCTAEKYGLDELKRVALRKQGLRKLNKGPPI
jgi:hypothetical protein